MTIKRDDTNKSLPKATIHITIALALVVLIWCMVYNYLRGFSSHTDHAAFGDAFGPLTALFNGLALAAIVVSLIYQRIDLSLQYTEFQRSVAAQVDAASAQEIIAEINAKRALLNSALRQLILYEENNRFPDSEPTAQSVLVDLRGNVHSLEY